MKQNVIDRFNAGTAENDVAYERARNNGFPWMFFFERAREKARMSGFLPEEGFLICNGRYVNSADRVVGDVLASMNNVGSPKLAVLPSLPWTTDDMPRWGELLCGISCMLFNCGVIAALTHPAEGADDPLAANGAWAIMGDVGFLGLQDKAMSFIRTLGGNAAEDLMGEVGDCACVHLCADQHNTQRAFKEPLPMREAYFRNACKAAYLAGAVFGEKVGGGK